jgi:hypothetical protein
MDRDKNNSVYLRLIVLFDLSCLKGNLNKVMVCLSKPESLIWVFVWYQRKIIHTF